MSKKLLVIVIVGCLVAGFAVGLTVRWPLIGGGGGAGATALQSPTKGPDDPLVTIIEISEFQ